MENAKIAVVDIRPGDTVFVHYEHALTNAQRTAIHAHFKDKFPEAAQVVILEMGMRVSVARAGSDELLEEIRDSVKSMASMFSNVTAGGNALLTEKV